jgi:hypothetical protein
MSVKVAYNSDLVTEETLTVNAAHLSAAKVTSSGLSTDLSNLISSSTPPCAQRAGAEVTLSNGSGSIDMAALLGTNGVTVVGTGQRAQFVKFQAKSDNANPITISKGGTNGYDGFGADFSISLIAGAEVLVRLMDAGSDVASGNRILDLTGTGSQVLSYEIILG